MASHRIEIQNKSIIQRLNFFSKYTFPILFITLTIGLRYEVGLDWSNYNEGYERIPISSIANALNSVHSYEWLFTILIFSLKNLGLPSYSIFVVCTFIVLILYYKTLDRIPNILSYGLFTLFTLDPFFLFLNIMRQCVSFFIVLFSIKYIIHKRPLRFLIWVIIAAGFHKTALIILPFYVFAYVSRLIVNRWLGLIMYMFTWFCGSILFNHLLSSISFFLDNEYSRYAETINFMNMEKQSGLGMLALHICDAIIIFMSPYCFDFFKKYGYAIYYNLFISGVILQNIAGMNMLLARLPLCLYSMRLIVGAFTLFICVRPWEIRGISLKTKNNMKIAGWVFIICALAYLTGNCLRFNYSFVFAHS